MGGLAVGVLSADYWINWMASAFIFKQQKQRFAHQHWCCDVDLDGVVTIADVTSIIDYLLRGHWLFRTLFEQIVVRVMGIT